MESKFIARLTNKYTDKRHRSRYVIYSKKHIKQGRNGRKTFCYGYPITLLAEYENTGLLPEEVQVLKEILIEGIPNDEKLTEIKENYINRTNVIRMLIQKMK